MSEDEPYQFKKEIKPAIGATKTICTFILKIENGVKSDYRSYSNYSKTKHAEILEVIILRNLTKISIVFLIENYTIFHR